MIAACERHDSTGPTRRTARRPSPRCRSSLLEQVYAVPFGALTKVQARARQREGLQALPHPAHVQRLARGLIARSTLASGEVGGRATLRLRSCAEQVLLAAPTRNRVAGSILVSPDHPFGLMQLCRAIRRRRIGGLSATPAQIGSRSARDLGLDEPSTSQLVRWYWRPAAGRSRPLDPARQARAEATLERCRSRSSLAAYALVLTLLLGIG